MSWGQLRDAIRENRDLARRESQEVPRECPIDGALLVAGPGGVLRCPEGNYQYGG